jgi:predicted HicB family RNase H-like nuclease
MANRKKPEGKKLSTPIQLRVQEQLRDDLNALAEETGVSTSERARQCLEQVVADWRAGKLKE